MKKIGTFIIVALVVFACNSSNKPSENVQAQEVNIANLLEVTIAVKGMTCAGCENAVRESIASLSGIEEVSASFVDSVAIVKYDKDLANLEAIEGKIAEAGYEVLK